MGTYHIAEICPNGHVITTSADISPELREKFCSKCGEPTTTQCAGCGARIRGWYYVEGVIGFGEEYSPPAYCHSCGEAFPWTSRSVASAVELLEAASDLSSEELEQFRRDLQELTKDTPQTQVASFRFSAVMQRVGSGVADGVKTIMVDVLSEAAKKAIFGS